MADVIHINYKFHNNFDIIKKYFIKIKENKYRIDPESIGCDPKVISDYILDISENNGNTSIYFLGEGLFELFEVFDKIAHSVNEPISFDLYSEQDTPDYENGKEYNISAHISVSITERESFTETDNGDKEHFKKLMEDKMNKINQYNDNDIPNIDDLLEV